MYIVSINKIFSTNIISLHISKFKHMYIFLTIVKVEILHLQPISEIWEVFNERVVNATHLKERKNIMHKNFWKYNIQTFLLKWKGKKGSLEE